VKFTKLVKYFILFSACSSAFADGRYFYTVKARDVFSSVLYGSGYTPIYGNQKGYLHDIAIYNNISVQKLDKISPGEKIYIPENLVIYGINNQFLKLKDKEKPSQEVIFRKQNSIAHVQTLSEIVAPHFAKPIVNSIANSIAKPKPVVVRKVSSEEEDKDYNQYSELTFKLGSGYSRVDSEISTNGSKAAFLSKPEEIFGVNWKFHLEEDFAIAFNLLKRTVGYSDSNRNSVLNDKINQTQLSTELIYSLPKAFNIFAEFGLSDMMFAPSYQTGTATVETRPINYYKAGLSKTFYKNKKINVDLGAAYTYLGSSESTNYSVQAGYGYEAFFKVSQKLSNYSVFIQSNLNQTVQNTSISKQNTKEFTSVLGVTFPFGENP